MRYAMAQNRRDRRAVSGLMTMLVVSLLWMPLCAGPPEDSASYPGARDRMVNRQIRDRGISDKRVLAAMRKVERHLFVPADFRGHAYDDSPLPIGEGQTISQPYIVALMTELADIEASDTVLEIGTGSGYQAAILGELAARVFTIEIVDTLAATARALLKELGYTNVDVRTGDGYLGWPEHAPFDAIIVTAAPPKVPQPLIDQLGDGAKMVIPVGEADQQLLLIEKKDGKVYQSHIAPVMFVPMTGDSTGVR